MKLSSTRIFLKGIDLELLFQQQKRSVMVGDCNGNGDDNGNGNSNDNEIEINKDINDIVPLQEHLINNITNPNVTRIRGAPSKKRIKSANML
ncbi:hypothetical protein RhiirA4_483015 [Rhizophagus irregularis]|uniref:Uncharacterized protein n=1 Tax=Rhizophagus irregularis TaxID=588596 RepID=A0A2I1HM00_9GLOM|nr:hypothetical protein RhiirA4_483015 [Rhizophagus irregularis]